MVATIPSSINTRKLRFVALTVPEIIGIPQKFGQSLDTPTLPFLQNFKLAFVQMDTVNVPAKFEVRSFTRSSDNNDWSFGLVCEPPMLGKSRG